jgi:hypothetical protein
MALLKEIPFDCGESGGNVWLEVDGAKAIYSIEEISLVVSAINDAKQMAIAHAEEERPEPIRRPR